MIWASVAASGSSLATNLIQLGAGEAADFAAHVGKCIEIPVADATAPKQRNYIRSVDTDNDTLTTAFPMDEVPFPTGTVKLLEGFTQEIGGNFMRYREFIFANDFNNGASHRCVVWRGQPVGGFVPIAGRGKTKQQMDIKLLGHTRTVDGLAQQVPMTCFGTYGKAVIV